VIVEAEPMQPIDLDTFTDLTPVAVVGMTWTDDGTLAVEFAADLDIATQDSVRRRMCSRNANEEELRRRAETALENNRADIAANEEWLAANPTASAFQKAAAQQSTRQARQLNAIIRMMLGFLDGTD
jgi:hypothetical protein